MVLILLSNRDQSVTSSGGEIIINLDARMSIIRFSHVLKLIEFTKDMIGGSFCFLSDVIVENSMWLGDVLASVCWSL